MFDPENLAFFDFRCIHFAHLSNLRLRIIAAAIAKSSKIVPDFAKTTFFTEILETCFEVNIMANKKTIVNGNTNARLYVNRYSVAAMRVRGSDIMFTIGT